jgi:hypothetical protein
LITNMFIFDVVGSVSIGLKKEQDKRMCGWGKLSVGFCSFLIKR